MTLYLVTGAAGFIGSNLVRALRERGLPVRGLDNLSTGKQSNLDDIDDVDLRIGDITDPGCVRDAMDGVTHVLHQAAVPSVSRSIDNPLVSHQANATGTLVLLEAARQAKTVQRFVYASSSSAYGDTAERLKVETMPPAPRSPYAVAKLAGELYVRIYAQLHQLPSVALRYFNVFGPYQDPQGRYAAVIPRFIRCALQHEPAPIEGDGLQSRDFTYIDNVVQANILACKAPHAVGHVINVACGTPVTVLELAQAVGELVGHVVPPLFGAPRPGDVRNSWADIGLAERLLGYRPEVNLREGLRRTIAWHRAHPR